MAAVDCGTRRYLERIAVDVPLPPTARTFVEKPAYRPPGSFRCFYVSPTWLGGGAPAGDVIAIKGMEPATGDFETALEGLRRPCYSPHSISEHLVFEEHKVPGSVTISEAQREAERAATIQSEHWRHFGELARLPMPLFVFRHALDTKERVLAALERELSEPAFHRASRSLADGLGVYVYRYPAPPVRVRDLESMLAGLDFRQRMFALLTICDPELLIRRWTTTFVRILYLGHLPATLASLRTGACCQPQNACLDGGFVDLDSLTPFSALPDDRAIYAALQISLDRLVETVHALLAESDPSAKSVEPHRVDRRFVEQHVLTLINEAFATQARSTLTLDPHVRSYFNSQLSFEGLVNALAAYSPPVDREFEKGVRGFGEFGFALLRAAAQA